MQNVFKMNTYYEESVNIIKVLYEQEPSSAIQCLFLYVCTVCFVQKLHHFDRLSMSSAITLAYLLFSLIFVSPTLCYVVLFLHNYCNFPYGIKTINTLGLAFIE